MMGELYRAEVIHFQHYSLSYLAIAEAAL